MSSVFISCSMCGHLSFGPYKANGPADQRCAICKVGRLNPLPMHSDIPTSRRSPPAHRIPKATHKIAEINCDMTGSIYVYLQYAEHVSTWVNGGAGVPLRLASDFKADELQGNMTPDESLIHESNVDLNAVRAIGIDVGSGMSQISFSNNTGPNGPIEDFWIHSSRYEYQDGRVQCFSRTNSRAIADFFGRSFCVRIDDIPRLKKILDDQVEEESIAGHCQYTEDFQRNPFLKGKNQAFMDEFRIYWPNFVKEKSFELPPGVGIEVPIAEPKAS